MALVPYRSNSSTVSVGRRAPSSLPLFFEYTEVFFKRPRLYSTLAYLSPTEYEEVYALQQAA